jgi:hypothetical protein
VTVVSRPDPARNPERPTRVVRLPKGSELYVGGSVGRRLPGFDAVAFCARELQPDFGDPKEQILIYAPLDDDPRKPPTREDRATALWAGEKVAGLLVGGRGKSVLVTCHEGLNRSSLVAGLAMRKIGYDVGETMTFLKAARGPNALSNQHFVRILEDV